MKRRILVALLVLVFAVPGVAVAQEPEPDSSLWSALVSWVDELVETITTPEDDEGSDDEEALPSTWATIDPIG